MKNLRKKIATVTKEEATKELTDLLLKDSYERINNDVEWFVKDCDEYSVIGCSFEEFLKKSESEQNEGIENWLFDSCYQQSDPTYLDSIVEEDIVKGKNKNLSDEEKEIYREVYYDVMKNLTTNKRYLETFRRKLNNYKTWNAKNTVNPDFNKGMNKINCIRVRLQKKLS